MLKREFLIFITVVLCFIVLSSTCVEAATQKKGILYPIFQNYSPLALTASHLDYIERSKFKLEDSVGVGVEVTEVDGDDWDLGYGLEVFQAKSHFYSYEARGGITINDKEVDYLISMINPFLRWRKRMHNDLWFVSFAVGMPFLRTNSKDINSLINFQTPGMLELALGLPLWQDMYLDLGWRKYIYDAETRHLASAPEADRDQHSTYEMNTFVVSIKLFVDIETVTGK